LIVWLDIIHLKVQLFAVFALLEHFLMLVLLFAILVLLENIREEGQQNVNYALLELILMLGPLIA
jgi:hypothetical protein